MVQLNKMNPENQNNLTAADSSRTTKIPVPAKLNNSLIILFSILLLVLLGATGFLYYQNQQLKTMLSGYQANSSITPTSAPDPFINWQTVNNAGYKYSIKYPPNFKAIATGMMPDLNNANEIVISQDPNKTGFPVMYIEATEKLGTVYKDLTLQEIAKEDFDANVANKNVLINITKTLESTTFADVPAYTFQMESQGFSGKWQGFLTYSGVNNVLEFDKSGFHYTIVYAENSDFNAIISTFKFTQTGTGQ